jgi:hypothetical protein
MNTIKTPSFEAIDNFSEMLSKKTNKTSYEDIKRKVSNYLVNNGSSKFVSLYNELVSNKDYSKAHEALKIE